MLFIFRTFRRGIYNLKLWPNVSPDVKYNSSTSGKIDPIVVQDQLLTSQTNKSTMNEQLAKQSRTATPPIISWNDDADGPTLDELGRIAKVTRVFSN
jgi:hypothetical protein